MLRAIQETILVLVGLSICVEYQNLNLGFVIITPSKAVNALLLAVASLEWAARKKSDSFPDRKAIWMVFFGVAVGLGTLQTFLSGFPVTPAIIVAQQMVALLMFYFVLTFVLSSQRRVKLVFGALVASGFLISVSALAGVGYSTGERLGGWGGNVNHAAQNLLVAISAAYALFLTSRSTLWRAVLACAIAVIAVSLINTFSRAAFLAIPVMGTLWLVRFGRLSVLRFAIPAFAVVLIAYFFMPEAAFERFETLNPDVIRKDGSAMSRVAQLPWAFRAIASNPLTGVGLSNFIFWGPDRAGFHVGTIHNMYLNVFAELGLMGFIPMMFILAMTWMEFTRSFRLARRLRRHGDREVYELEVQSIMLQIGLLGCLVMSMFHPTATKKVFWLLFAASTALWRLTRARRAALVPETEVQEPAWDSFHPAAATAFRSTLR